MAKITDLWWGELRAALDEPGLATWRRICNLLEYWPSPQERDDVVNTYCLLSLERWPEHVRREPLERWVRAASQGEPEPCLRMINTLCLGSAMMSDVGLRMLLEVECFERLTELSLRNNLLGEVGMQWLTRAPFYTSLHTLDLENNCLSDGGAHILSHTPPTRLRSLNLKGNRIGHEGASELAASSSFSHLRSLELDPGELGLHGIQLLADSRTLPDEVRERWRHTPLTTASAT